MRLTLRNPDGLPGMDGAVDELETGVPSGTQLHKVPQSDLDKKRKTANMLGMRNCLDWDLKGAAGNRLAASLSGLTGKEGLGSIAGNGVKLPGAVSVADLLFPRGTDCKHTIQLESAITSVSWSRKRVWHGEEVKLHVGTLNVSDNSELEIKIYPKSNAQAAPPALPSDPRQRLQMLRQRVQLARKGLGLVPKPVHEIKETIKGNKFETSYKVDFKDKNLSGRCRTFFFVVRLPELGLKKKSPPLWVDLDAFSFSL